jgi:ribonuclease HIII
MDSIMSQFNSAHISKMNFPNKPPNYRFKNLPWKVYKYKTGQEMISFNGTQKFITEFT